MADRSDLQQWVIEALQELSEPSRIADICKHIWEHHERDLRTSGDLFYTWQYEMRWAGQQLRNRGALRPVRGRRNQLWELV